MEGEPVGLVDDQVCDLLRVWENDDGWLASSRHCSQNVILIEMWTEFGQR